VTAELEQARQARRILEKLHRKLLLPTLEVFNDAPADLTVAAQSLQRLELSLTNNYQARPGRQAVQRELAMVRCELQIVNALVSSAGNFYEGLARLMPGAEPAGVNYTAEGEAVSQPSQPSTGVVLHG
jgi:hypothetical protein